MLNRKSIAAFESKPQLPNVVDYAEIGQRERGREIERGREKRVVYFNSNIYVKQHKRR